MFKLSPSILAANFASLGEEVKAIEKAGADWVHIDVMDGMFVPSISFGMPVMKAIRPCTDLVFDVHLMIEDPDRYLEEFVSAGANLITVHAEACKHLHRTVKRIKELGVKVGVAINPGTSLTAIEYVLEEVDMVLIMSVNPGFGGQKFIPFTIDKIRALKEMMEERNLSFDIQVDGGVTLENVGELIEAGANVFVAGTAVFAGDINTNVSAFRGVFEHVSSKHEGGEIH